MQQLALPLPSTDRPGGFRVHQGAQEEVVDDRLQFGDGHQRVRAMIDKGQPMISDVGSSSLAQCEYEFVGREDWDLHVRCAIDQQQGRCFFVDISKRRCLAVEFQSIAFRHSAEESLDHFADLTTSGSGDQINRAAVAGGGLHKA